MEGRTRIFEPLRERCFSVIARAVPAAEKIELEHCAALVRKSSRRSCGHRSRLVHLVAEGGEMKNEQRNLVGGSPVYAEALPALYRQVKRRLGDSQSLAPILLSTNATKLPTVANVDPSISSSSIEIPKRSSSDVSTFATAIESSSGMLPSNGVSSRNLPE